MSFLYNIHNLFQIKSDIDLNLNDFVTEKVSDTYDISIRSLRYKDIEKNKCRQISSGLYYSKMEESICSDLNIFGIRIYWELKDLLNDHTELLLSKSYNFISKYIMLFQVASVHRVESLFRMILQIKLLLNGGTFLIGSATSFKDKCIIFSGTHGSGKTMSNLHYIDRHNSNFLSDDHMIIFNNRIYSFPTPIKLRKYNLDFVSYAKYVDPAEFFASDRLENVVEKCDDIYFLEKSEMISVKDISSDEGIRKLCNINNKAIQYFNERLFSSLPYLYDSLSLLDLQKRQDDVLRSVFERTRFHIISAKHIQDYADLIN